MCFSNIDIKKNKERSLELLRSTGREGMKQFRPKLCSEVTKNNIIIASLLHDICNS